MDDAGLAEAVRTRSVFGRVPPSLKARLVGALRESGEWVAMVGDGVNDILSLKQAQLGISMQSGSQATRAVADIVLLEDSFSALPEAVIEGQRIIAGMHDSLAVFLTRVLYMALVILGAVAGRPGDARGSQAQHGRGTADGGHPGPVPGGLGTARRVRPRCPAPDPATGGATRRRARGARACPCTGGPIRPPTSSGRGRCSRPSRCSVAWPCCRCCIRPSVMRPMRRTTSRPTCGPPSSPWRCSLRIRAVLRHRTRCVTSSSSRRCRGRRARHGPADGVWAALVLVLWRIRLYDRVMSVVHAARGRKDAQPAA